MGVGMHGRRASTAEVVRTIRHAKVLWTDRQPTEILPGCIDRICRFVYTRLQ